MADMLLLNASNFAQFPVYPYAFVQIRALAKRAGLSVHACDLLGRSRGEWPAIVEELVRTHRPRMVGVHLRQADSVSYADYVGDPALGYFPLEDTRDLVRCVRRHTRAPIAAGGFGFTTHAREIFDYLEVEYGCEGEPNGLLASFDQLAAGGDPASIENLLYRDGSRAVRTPRVFHAPLDEREYDDDVVRELEAFYGRSLLYGEGAPSVAVELARGCAYRCSFCTEPQVKGRKERRRDLDAVMDDVAFLVASGLRRFWMVCSELNQGNAQFALEVAERFIALRERRGGAPLRWHAYHLPRFLDRADLALLYRSGFAGGWNDLPSLDDENLRAIRVPYRSKHAVAHLHHTLAIHPTDGYGQAPRFSLFLGNVHATPAVVARSIERFHDEQLFGWFGSARIGAATRVFSPDAGATPQGAVTFRRTSAGAEPAFIHPTYVRPGQLERALGGEAPLLAFFRYVESTLLSDEHQLGKDWVTFLVTAAPLAWTAGQLQQVPRRRLAGLPAHLAGPVDAALQRLDERGGERALAELLVDRELDAEARQLIARLLVHRIAWPAPKPWLDVLARLGIAHDADGRITASTYAIVRALLPAYGGTDELIDDVAAAHGFSDPCRELWLLRCVLFERNVKLRAEYRPLLIPVELQPSLSPQVRPLQDADAKARAVARRE